MMPRNVSGVPIEPADYNRSDGFSPGQAIVLKVPGLDTPAAFERTGAVPITDVGRSFERRQPVVVINACTGRRHLIWAELDSNATTPDGTALLIHPAVNSREGSATSWPCATCAAPTAAGSAPGAPSGSTATASRTSSRSLRRRRRHLEGDLPDAGRAGIERPELSRPGTSRSRAERSRCSERPLSIRDRAFLELGDPNLRDLEVDGVAPAF